MSAGGFQPLRRRRALDVATLYSGPNMTPMVDVVMVILVFFMVSAAFLGPEWLLSSLVPQLAEKPAAATSGAGAGPRDPFEVPPVRFTIDLKRQPDGSVVATGGEKTDASIEDVVSSLKTMIKDAGSNVEVLVKPGVGVPWGAVVRTHELCNQAGITRVGPETKRRS